MTRFGGDEECGGVNGELLENGLDLIGVETGDGDVFGDDALQTEDNNSNPDIVFASQIKTATSSFKTSLKLIP